MGYTHYFKQEKWTDNDKKGFIDSLPIIDEIVECFCTDLVIYEISDKCIDINGVGDNSHENLIIYNEKNNFSFCKTERKPYDLPVVCILTVLEKNCRNFIVTSDDKNTDNWKYAKLMYNT